MSTAKWSNQSFCNRQREIGLQRQRPLRLERGDVATKASELISRLERGTEKSPP
jgi:hypothetical protein